MKFGKGKLTAPEPEPVTADPKPVAEAAPVISDDDAELASIGALAYEPDRLAALAAYHARKNSLT